MVTRRVIGWGTDPKTAIDPYSPPYITGVAALAGAVNFSMALLNNGTIVKLIDQSSSDMGKSLYFPEDLTGVKAIAAGAWHCLALKNDGTVVAWGSMSTTWGSAYVPEGLSDVVAIAAGSYSMALLADGTVVPWRYLTEPDVANPDELVDVVAIAGASRARLALLADGTVVQWGSGWGGSPPEDLSDVVAIATGGYHGLALKDDGTVVAWGLNDYGQCDVPTGLSGVTAIAATQMYAVAYGYLSSQRRRAASIMTMERRRIV